MSADRELLGMAAKAAGYEILRIYDDPKRGVYVDPGITSRGFNWSPLYDVADAFKLAMHLRFRVDFNAGTVHHLNGTLLAVNVDICRAITEAAAQIGRSMK